jgi:hypothetical protein
VRKWNPRAVIRVFAILNVALCAFGLWAMTYGFARTASQVGAQYDPSEPYVLQVFYVDNAVDFICLVFGLVSALPLWRLRRGGLILCNLLFGFELLFLFTGAFLAMGMNSSHQVIGDLAWSVAGAAGIGHLGMTIQDVTLYPIIALIALNMASEDANAADILIAR